MKVTEIAFSIFTLFLLVGCSEKIDLIIEEQPSMFILAEGGNPAFDIALHSGDKIGINGEEYTILSGRTIGMYEVPIAEQYYIYYPSSIEASNNSWRYTLPKSQKYSKESVDKKANPLFGKANNEELKNEELTLKPIVGGLKVVIPKDEDFVSVSSISLRARSESDVLAGELIVDVESGEWSWGEEQNDTLEMDGDINISEGGEVIFAVPEMEFSGDIDVKMTSLKGEATASLQLEGKTIKPGEVLSIELDEVKWVSIREYYGKANTVLVNPGNPSITVDCAPYYTTSLVYAYENIPHSDTSKIAKSAKMLWNDVGPDFMNGVSLSSDGKSFTASLSGQSGNAVVAIYDNEDPEASGASILWSFHIWVTDINEHQLDVNVNGNRYTLLDRNVGAVSVTPGDWRSIGFLYQWGRKDPFVSTEEYAANKDVTIYNESGAFSRPSPSAGNDETGTIEWSIKNPMRFLRHSRTNSNVTNPPIYFAYDWLRYSDNALWGNPKGYESPDQSTLEKSIYDPCPEGYMIAPYDTWRGPSSGNDKAASVLANADWHASKGFVWNEGAGEPWWYPIGGWRGRSNGNLGNADAWGYYWYSTVENGNSSNGAFMSINNDNVVLNGKNSRANTCSVRCVKIQR